jgi:hypothetical protein
VGIASLVCSLAALPGLALPLLAMWLLGPGAVVEPGVFLYFSLPTLAVVFGGLGLARARSAGGRGRWTALAGLLIGVFEVCVFTLATVFMLTHGDRIA